MNERGAEEKRNVGYSKYDYEPERTIMRNAVKAVLNGEGSIPVIAGRFVIAEKTLRKYVAKENSNFVDNKSENRGTHTRWDNEPERTIMRNAVKAVLDRVGSATEVADRFGIPPRTLRRYVSKEREKSE